MDLTEGSSGGQPANVDFQVACVSVHILGLGKSTSKRISISTLSHERLCNVSSKPPDHDDSIDAVLTTV